jgi:predicted HicB family RNase H-like nuclease
LDRQEGRESGVRVNLNVDGRIALAQKRDGKEPERPYSWNFTVRVSLELHHRVATAAARKCKSVNTFVAETLDQSA